MAIDGVRLNPCPGKDIVGRPLSTLQFVVLLNLPDASWVSHALLL